MTLEPWGSEPGNSKTGITLSMITDGTSKTSLRFSCLNRPIAAFLQNDIRPSQSRRP
jgi:hypothetical protein